MARYHDFLTEAFPWAPDENAGWFQKLPPTLKQQLRAARFENSKTCAAVSCHAAYVHGAHIYKLVRDPQVAVLCHEEGAEHLFRWIYTFLSVMGKNDGSAWEECNAIMFVIIGGCLAGFPPITIRGRKVRLLRTKNSAYADYDA